MFHICDLDCKEYKDRDHPIPGRWGLGSWEFDRCPKTYITENVDDWLMSYRMFEKGHFYNDGMWPKQASKYLKVMLFIDSQIIAHNQKAK